MAYRMKGLINDTLLKPASFLDHECFIPNTQFATRVQYDSLVKSWIYGSMT